MSMKPDGTTTRIASAQTSRTIARARYAGRARTSLIAARVERLYPDRKQGFTRSGSALDEGEQIGIDDLRMRRAHAVWQPRIDFQRRPLHEPGGEQGGVGIRHDLVV